MIILLAVAQAMVAPMPVTMPPVVPIVVPAAAASANAVVTLAQDTPVELMAVSEVNTDDAKPGMIFKLRLNRAIIVDGRTIAPVGAPAFGQVLTASDAGGHGKSGRMTAKLLHLRVGEVEVPLEGQTIAKGTGSGSTGVAVLLSGWMGLFHRGNNAKIKAGELLNGYVTQDMALDLSGTMPRLAAATSSPSVPVSAPITTLPVSASVPR